MVTVFWNWIGCNAAEIIALSALLFTGYQTLATRRHNRLSVKPHLVTFGNRSENIPHKTISVTLQNNGLGPAVIKSYEFEVKGESYIFETSEEAHKFFETIIGNPNASLEIATLCPGHVFNNNDQLKILEVKIPIHELECIENFEDFLEQSAINIKYESMYGEKYRYHSIDSHSQ